MWLGGVSVFGSFAARYSSEAALCGNTRNICHKQTPSRYDWKTVESDVKHHSLTHFVQYHNEPFEIAVNAEGYRLKKDDNGYLPWTNHWTFEIIYDTMKLRTLTPYYAMAFYFTLPSSILCQHVFIVLVVNVVVSY